VNCSTLDDAYVQSQTSAIIVHCLFDSLIICTDNKLYVVDKISRLISDLYYLIHLSTSEKQPYFLEWVEIIWHCSLTNLKFLYIPPILNKNCKNSQMPNQKKLTQQEYDKHKIKHENQVHNYSFYSISVSCMGESV
jgi:hypothetical protein